jgi:CheY-like chemotaxis protein
MESNNVILNFNLPPLLVKNVLDIRGVAMKNSALKAEGYFERVEYAALRLPALLKKLENYPQNSDSTIDGDASIMSKLLLEIGYSKAEHTFNDFFYKPDRPKTAEKLHQMLSVLSNALTGVYSDKGWRNLFYLDTGKEDLEKLTLMRLLSLIDMAEQNRKPRILAVDDVSVVLSAISAVLEKDYEIFCLTRAEQVEKFLTHTMPDLFLLDIEMPNINGHELIKIIRTFDEHKETPIIFLTGNATVKNFQAAMTQGVSDFISKPVDPVILLKKVGDRIVKKKLS